MSTKNSEQPKSTKLKVKKTKVKQVDDKGLAKVTGGDQWTPSAAAVK